MLQLGVCVWGYGFFFNLDSYVIFSFWLPTSLSYSPILCVTEILIEDEYDSFVTFHCLFLKSWYWIQFKDLRVRRKWKKLFRDCFVSNFGWENMGEYMRKRIFSFIFNLSQATWVLDFFPYGFSTYNLKIISKFYWYVLAIFHFVFFFIIFFHFNDYFLLYPKTWCQTTLIQCKILRL